MAEIEEGAVRVARDGHVLTIELDRPSKRNALTPLMIRDYSAALALLDRDDDIRCALVTASGNHFTAGLDLPQATRIWDSGGTLYPPELPHICDVRTPYRRKPMVIALQGISFTFGVELMLSADVAVAAKDCRFAVLEVTRGIIASAGATFRFPERAGWSNAMRWLLTGDEFGAEEALRMGLVQEIVEPGMQKARALQLAQRIAANAPLAVLATRANARQAAVEGDEAAVSCIDQIRTRLRASQDAAEGFASFLERRPARFTGR